MAESVIRDVVGNWTLEQTDDGTGDYPEQYLYDHDDLPLKVGALHSEGLDWQVHLILVEEDDLNTVIPLAGDYTRRRYDERDGVMRDLERWLEDHPYPERFLEGDTHVHFGHF